jgi:hypothetical protein
MTTSKRCAIWTRSTRSASAPSILSYPRYGGSHENGDIFFQHREACNKYYEAVPAIVEEYMDKVNAKIALTTSFSTTTARRMPTASL